MRNKLFLAFVAVIVTALVSNIIYLTLSLRDFDDYVSGVREDMLYWLMASAEGSYSNGSWDDKQLHDTVHWALMLGFDVRVDDLDGRELASSVHVMHMLSGAMKRRMESMIDLEAWKGNFETYPLYMEGKEIGTLRVRALRRRGEVDKKEARFREQGQRFMIVSLLIAGGGAVLLSLVFTFFFSRPLKRMKSAVEAMAAGDLGTRMPAGSGDEIGSLAQSFNYLAEALEREETLRRHLSSNIAHELRTPLAIMKANVEAVIDGVVSNRAQALENIHAEIEKLILLVNGIEDMIRAEASFFEKMEFVPVELSGFLASLASKIAPLAAEKGLSVRVRSTGPLTVVTDSDKLERIVQNLLSNAIKYTDVGEIVIWFGEADDRVFVSVSDTGPGIPDDQTELIFKRFFRGEGSKGLGLGLAIVRELADVLGGNIEFSRRPEGGSVFTVWLPLRR